MSYDWEKIFENKTNKELYDIVIGKKVLSNEAMKFAKTELENRNFDFDNMEANKAAWEISSLIEEDDYARLEITGRRANHISIRNLFIIIAGIFIIYFVLSKFPDYDFPLGMAFFFSGLATVFILLNNIQAKRQKLAQEKRIEKITQLKEKLDKQNLLTTDNPIKNEIQRHRLEEIKGIKTISYLMIGISAIMILIFILKRIL
jgi:hypothetical protein